MIAFDTTLASSDFPSAQRQAVDREAEREAAAAARLSILAGTCERFDATDGAFRIIRRPQRMIERPARKLAA